MTLALRATNDGGGVILLNGSPKITLDAAGNIVGTLTPGRGDSSQKLANTGFVKQMMGNYGGWFRMPSGGAIPESALGKVVHTPSPGVTVSMPIGASIPHGSFLRVQNTSSGTTTVTTQNGEPLYYGGDLVSSIKLGTNDNLELATCIDGNGAFLGWMAIGGTAYLGASATFGSLKAQNGWQKLPGGLILQWGTINMGPYSTPNQFLIVPFNFPISFPSQVAAVGSSIRTGVSPTVFTVASIENWRTDGADAIYAGGFSGLEPRVSYLAIGW